MYKVARRALIAGLALGKRRVNRRAVRESSVEAVDCL